ncbi:uncharacterized protein LOC123518047 [Portunus trituberculatus]|uniref:uncharacterized protein LOC123518047 n=1 Tax=Portunus trituberculatus TaxID=210409 RepID=UPI001E1D17BA|nr:uncharacterized protein LOC123518047 [Portunus trituberculatus]
MQVSVQSRRGPARTFILSLSLQSREDDSGISGTTLSTTAHSAFSSGSSKRTCVHQECSRALPNISHDPHTRGEEQDHQPTPHHPGPESLIDYCVLCCCSLTWFAWVRLLLQVTEEIQGYAIAVVASVLIFLVLVNYQE